MALVSPRQQRSGRAPPAGSARSSPTAPAVLLQGAVAGGGPEGRANWAAVSAPSARPSPCRLLWLRTRRPVCTPGPSRTRGPRTGCSGEALPALSATPRRPQAALRCSRFEDTAAGRRDPRRAPQPPRSSGGPARKVLSERAVIYEHAQRFPPRQLRPGDRLDVGSGRPRPTTCR